MPASNKGVASTHAGYDKYAAKWKRCRDVSDGQDAVHAAGAAYLPKLKDQEEEAYKAYVKRAGFYNATWRTIGGLLGMLFRKPPKVEIPKAIEPHLKDVDLAGTSIDTYARQVALEVLEVGRLGIMVDHPPQQTGEDGKIIPITVAVAEQMGMRPTLKLYPAESIINWKYRRVRNRNMLSQVRLEELVQEPDGEWAEKSVKQWRVLDLDDAGHYRVRVYRREKEADVLVEGPFYPLMNGKPLDFIPFAIVGVDGVESALDEPPLIDLVDLNLSHYRTNADYEHGCHFTGLPTPVVSGYSPPGTGKDGTGPPEKLYIGSSHAWVFTDANAKASYLEFTGQGLTALKENLDRKEQQMAILGARMLAAEKKQAETATTAAIHRTGENSVLSAISMAVSEALEWALTVFAKWAGHEAEIVYQLNRDFMPAGIDAPQLTALVNAWQSGTLSDEELFDLFQRGDLIDSEKTLGEHQAQVEINAPAPARPAPKPDEGAVAA